MLKIVLVCCAGMSTSMLIRRMADAAKDKGIEAEIEAVAEPDLEGHAARADILLLAPQVRYLKPAITAKYGNMIKAIEVINFSDYGLMNGEKVLDSALERYDGAISGTKEGM
jgi:PTS system cellobiose-specific IIB component